MSLRVVAKFATEAEKTRYIKDIKRENRIWAAENCPHPERKDLNRKQWAEWGENMRILKGVGFVNREHLSLQDTREVVMSIQKMTVLRAAYSLR